MLFLPIEKGFIIPDELKQPTHPEPTVPQRKNMFLKIQRNTKFFLTTIKTQKYIPDAKVGKSTLISKLFSIYSVYESLLIDTLSEIILPRTIINQRTGTIDITLALHPDAALNTHTIYFVIHTLPFFLTPIKARFNRSLTVI